MNFEMFRHQLTAPPQPEAPDFGGEEQSPANGRPQGSVQCRHGIHSGRFPVAGMRLRDARRILNQLLNIDPEAVAVSNGQILEDDQIIGSDIEVLNFVKKSSIKG